MEPSIGTNRAKQEPCNWILPSEFCKPRLRSALIIPITTNLQKVDTFPIRVRIPKGTCSLEKESEALIEQILAWDLELFRRDLGLLPEALQERVKEAIKDFLDI